MKMDATPRLLRKARRNMKVACFHTREMLTYVLSRAISPSSRAARETDQIELVKKYMTSIDESCFQVDKLTDNFLVFALFVDGFVV